jgi:hypothetical protein
MTVSREMYFNYHDGRTWVVDVPTILYKIRNYLDHPHVSRF